MQDFPSQGAWGQQATVQLCQWLGSAFKVVVSLTALRVL